jgi:hypothetical protein
MPTTATHPHHAARVVILAALALGLLRTPCLAQELRSQEQLRALHEEVLVADLGPWVLTQQRLRDALRPLLEEEALRVIAAGRSAEGRRLTAYAVGDGPRRVLLWSQAHGDAPTGTRVLADLLHHLVSERARGTSSWLDSLTVVVLPMVNPDGAEIGERRSSHGIDILLDGRRRSSPEGRALHRLAENIPTSIAIGLEAGAGPAAGEPRAVLSVPSVAPEAASYVPRDRSIRLADHLAQALAEEPAGTLVRRERPFDPRSVPDAMQTEFRRVVLLGLRAEPAQEAALRRNTFAALLSALEAFATGGLEGPPNGAYGGLDLLPPPAPDPTVDLLIRDARVRIPDLRDVQTDVAVAYADAAARTGGRVVEVGDLDLAAADTLEEARLSITFNRGGLEAGTRRSFRLEPGVLADFAVIRRTRTYQSTLYTMVNGALTRPADHRFPRRARWFISVQPPFLTQEISRHHRDVEVAVAEVGWGNGDPRHNGSSRSISSFQLSAGRTMASGLAVELVVGSSDDWSTRASRLDSRAVMLAQEATYGAVLLSYEIRNLRLAAGPAFIGERWKWSSATLSGDESGSVRSPGLLWEASVALPAGTRWAPQLRVQHRSFYPMEIGGFGNIPPFEVRHSTFSVGLGTTFRWWAGD